MAERMGKARWTGGLKGGNGTVTGASGALNAKYSFATRFEDEPGTNPEELIGAAHAGCFSMALAAALEKAGFPPDWIETSARVTLAKSGEGFAITRIDLETRGSVPGIDADGFGQHAEGAKANCPVSKALSAVPMTLKASLV